MLRYHSAFLSNVTRLLVWPHSCFLEMKRRFRASAWDKWQNHCNLFYKEWRQKKEEGKKRIRNWVQSLWEPSLYVLFTKRMSWGKGWGAIVCIRSHLLILRSHEYSHNPHLLAQQATGLFITEFDFSEDLGVALSFSKWYNIPLFPRENSLLPWTTLQCFFSVTHLLMAFVFQTRLDKFCFGLCRHQSASHDFWGSQHVFFLHSYAYTM